MENIFLERTIEIWAFQLNDNWFEVHVECDNDERKIKQIFKEKDEVTDEERETINEWVKTIDHT